MAHFRKRNGKHQAIIKRKGFEGIAFDYDKKTITVRAAQEPLKAICRANSGSTRKVEDGVEDVEYPF